MLHVLIFSCCSVFTTPLQMDPGRTKVSSFSDCSQLSSRQCRDEATYHRALHDLMPVYSGQSGCFLYVLSLVMTRGVEMVVGDMDDHRTTCKMKYSPTLLCFSHLKDTSLPLCCSNWKLWTLHSRTYESSACGTGGCTYVNIELRLYY